MISARLKPFLLTAALALSLPVAAQAQVPLHVRNLSTNPADEKKQAFDDAVAALNAAFQKYLLTDSTLEGGIGEINKQYLGWKIESFDGTEVTITHFMNYETLDKDDVKVEYEYSEEDWSFLADRFPVGSVSSYDKPIPGAKTLTIINVDHYDVRNPLYKHESHRQRSKLNGNDDSQSTNEVPLFSMSFPASNYSATITKLWENVIFAANDKVN